MNILLLGAGGREHALAWKMAQSPKLNKLYIAPGNAGTQQYGENVSINPTDFAKIKSFALNNAISIIVVGPEEPLVKGIVNFFREDSACKNIAVIGPDKFAAQLEGSKDFAKQFMNKYKIPTASYKSFTKDSYNEATHFLKTLSPPYVLKADGLAAGKGVVICASYEQAEKELHGMLNEEKFGDASSKVVIEEFLSGVELSVFVATDGVNYKMLPHAKDYKKIGENDTGLNTGGMGAVSPVPFVDEALMDRILKHVVEPTVEGIKSEKMDYRGFVFIGLMVVNGYPFVIEYNVRMGDPETEVVVPLLKSDIIELFSALHSQTLDSHKICIDASSASTVMIVSEGYPESYEKNKEIIISSQPDDKCLLFHAGTKMEGEQKLMTNGGRVIAVTAFGNSLAEALKKSYSGVGLIHFDGAHYRNDIGKDMLKIIEEQKLNK